MHVKIRATIWRLRQWLGMRLVLWAASWSGSGWGRCANRHWIEMDLAGRELLVQLRDLRQPDGYERTEVLRMLQKVRMAEAMHGWTCPDPGAPKYGLLVCDGVPVD